MDPFSVLGVTASLITCIQLSGALLKRVGPSDHNKKELNHILKALYGFRGAYEGIKSYLELNEEDEARLSALKELEAPLRDCKVALEFLEERLKNVNFVGKYIVGCFWDGRFKRLLQRLEDAKGLFELALHADQQIIMKAVESYIRNVAEDVRSIQTTINENGKRLIDVESRAEENHEQSKRWRRDIGESIHQISANVRGHYNDAKDWKFGLEKRDKQEHQRKVNQWLSPPDSSSNYNAACRKREPMTGSWFIERGEFAAWKANPGLFMWLHGIPGCGKTILSSTIIEDTISYCQPSPTLVLAYFYFDFNDEGKLLVKHFLSSVITQLCTQTTVVPRVLETAYSRSDDGRQEPRIDDLSTGLKEFLSMHYQIYMIIDALDECTERDELLELVVEMVSWSGNLHLLVTSRKERDIEEAVESLVTSQVCIQSELVNADIRRHISQRLIHDSKLKRWPTTVKEEIRETLVGGANGMFRWAVCQLDALRKCLTINSLRKTLKSLPKTLDDTYERILTNIDEEYIQDAIKVLQCLAYSPRPLRISEVAEVLAVDVDRELRFDIERRLPESRDILRICSSLVTLSSSRRDVSNNIYDHGHTDDSDETGVLRLAHFSVKEYLVSERIRTGPASIFHLTETAAALSMAKTCIVYLLQFDGPSSLSIDNLYDFPIVRLSAQYWLQYVDAAQGREDNAMDSLILKLLESRNECFANWIRIYDPVAPLSRPGFTRERRTIAPPLYYVSLCGSLRALKLLLDREAEANLEARGELGRTALIAAAYRGTDAVVRLLIEKGAKIEAKDNRGETALITAAWRGEDTIVRLLIEKGANINAKNDSGETALMSSVGCGSDEVVRLLIENGADTEAEDCIGETALIAAARREEDTVVRLLIEKGANIDAKNESGETALIFSVESGSDEVVRLLIENGAKIEAKDNRGETALITAAWLGKYAVIRLLIEMGAIIDVGDNRGRTALMTAAQCGEDAIVRLLLENGANTEARDSDGKTALIAAAENEYEAVARLLIENGANIDAKDNNGETALLVAAKNEDIAVAWLLIKNRANIDAKDHDGETALTFAVRNGRDAIVQLLIEKGANIDAKNNGEQTALMIAASYGEELAARLLVENGADIEAKSSSGKRPLHFAVVGSWRAMVRLLIGKGADVEAKFQGKTALDLASTRGHKRIIEILSPAQNLPPTNTAQSHA